MEGHVPMRLISSAHDCSRSTGSENDSEGRRCFEAELHRRHQIGIERRAEDRNIIGVIGSSDPRSWSKPLTPDISTEKRFPTSGVGEAVASRTRLQSKRVEHEPHEYNHTQPTYFHTHNSNPQ